MNLDLASSCCWASRGEHKAQQHSRPQANYKKICESCAIPLTDGRRQWVVDSSKQCNKPHENVIKPKYFHSNNHSLLHPRSSHSYSKPLFPSVMNYRCIAKKESYVRDNRIGVLKKALTRSKQRGREHQQGKLRRKQRPCYRLRRRWWMG